MYKQLIEHVDIDPRVTNWPLMQNPAMVLSIILLYLVFVQFIGPKWMKNRKPFELQKTMVVYSFTLAIANAWVFNKFGVHGWYRRNSWICEPLDPSDNEDALGMAKALWTMYMLKFVDLIDTVIFVLRKKTSQITFLHVLHHAIVPILSWYAVIREPGGYNTLFPFVNSFVHIVMYTYYGLAALGPGVQKYLWWKKYITVLQIGQFVIIFFLMIRLAIAPPCKVSTDMVAINLFSATLFLCLFLKFFIKSYKPKRINTDKPSVITNGVRTKDEPKLQKNGNEVKRVIVNGHTKDT